MVLVDSSSTKEENDLFDLNSQAGILLVLQAIRLSGLPVLERNELRDLVFLYSTGDNDPAMQSMIQERLRSHQITPSLIPKKKSNTPVNYNPGFSKGRPAPIFTPSTVTEKLTTVEPKLENKVTPVTTIAPTVSATPATPATPVTLATNDEVIKLKNDKDNIVPVSAPFKSEQNQIKPIIPKIIHQTIADQLDAQKKPVERPVTSAVSLEHLNRIREIKSDINNKVGNPVNLIEIDNIIGRDYMTTLLEAMKQLNAGTEEEIVKSMQRLEVVYEEVKTLIEVNLGKTITSSEKIIKNNDITPIKPTIPKAITSETVLTPQTPEQSFHQPEIKKIVSTEKVPEVDATPKDSFNPSVSSFSQIPEIEQSDWSSPVKIPERQIQKSPVTVPVPKAPAPKEMMSNSVRPIVEIPKPPATPKKIAPLENSPVAPNIPIVNNEVVASVATVTPLKTPQDLPSADSLKLASQEGDPLYTKEVDNGLDQLLSEWVLFMKSGLFGTGPRGREHPLFKKIAPISMPLLLSGRFEGATPEIKQSITDYMNGWRYEQGIIYEQNETFEQYLRRVIRHIIDWQNNKHGT